VEASELTHRDEAPASTVEIIELVLPAGTGYTLRTYPDAAGAPERAAFLTREGRLLLFRGAAGLADYLATDRDHDLAALPGWPHDPADIVPDALVFLLDGTPPAAPTPDPTPERTGDPVPVRDLDVAAGTDPAVTRHDPAVTRYEFDLVPTNLRGTADQWIPELLLPVRDLTVELATALELRRIRTALADGEYLDRFDDALRAAETAGTFSRARRRLRTFDPARLSSQWRQIIRWLEQSVRWVD
jgi:hypothetical protein